MNRPQISKWLTILQNELRKIDRHSEFPQAGDLIFWDMRLVHQNGNQNLSGQVRQTFYHAYLPCGDVNFKTIENLQRSRDIGIHPPEYPKSHAHIEQKGYRPCDLSDLGLLLYGYKQWTPETVITNNEPTITLTPHQITFFKRYGYVVIPACIPKPLINSLTLEIDTMLRKNGIHPENLGRSTKGQWSNVAGTFGGMLEFYFAEYQEKIREHPNGYWATVQLLENTWFAENRAEIGFWHPFGDLNPRNLWLYVDRMNYRLPEELMVRISKNG